MRQIPTLDDRQRAGLLRWRLVLGRKVEDAPCDAAGLFALADLAGRTGHGEGLGTETGSAGTVAATAPARPEADVFGLDGSLEFVYGDSPRSSRATTSAPAMPHIPRWLADIRRYFPNDVVAVIQKDAVERRGLKQLIFEPETLPQLERNVDLLATIVALQEMIPDETRDTARIVVREIAEEIRKKLEPRIRTAVFGALNRNRHSAMPVYRNIDWKRTIQRNLKNYDPSTRQLVPERFYFWANQRKLREWHVIVCVDQSGSMATSVVYSSIMASIFASLNALRTSLVLWSTEVVDMTELLRDPVDVLFGPQLGGGNDAPKALAYCPGWSRSRRRRSSSSSATSTRARARTRWWPDLRELVESKVKLICLLALTDTGKPSYNHKAAKRVAKPRRAGARLHPQPAGRTSSRRSCRGGRSMPELRPLDLTRSAEVCPGELHQGPEHTSGTAP